MSQASDNMGASASVSNVITFPRNPAPRARSAEEIRAELETIHARLGFEAAHDAANAYLQGIMGFWETYYGANAYTGIGARLWEIGRDGASVPVAH